MATGTLTPGTGDGRPSGDGGTTRRPGPALRHRRRFAGGVVALVAVGLVAVLSPKVSPPSSAAGRAVAVTTPLPPGTSGTTVAGVRCGPGVRQVPFSAYSPICVPAWHGVNGGATANGVTKKTITLVYREASSNVLSALYGVIPQSVVGTNTEAIATMRSYIKVFNRYFELYGRKVVLKPFNGRGDFVAEDQGSGVGAAQEDALTVADQLHAFADMSLVDSTVIYDDALQKDDVPAFGLYLQDSSWYRQAAPYQYTVGPTCTQSDQAIADLLGSPAVADSTATYAGPGLRHQQRRYGIIYPDNPQADVCAERLAQELTALGHPPAAAVSFEFQLSTLGTAAQNAIGQLSARHVTTVICASCDPVSPIDFLAAAKDAGYAPEWLVQSYFAGGSAALDGYWQNILAKSGDSAGAGGLLALGTGGQVTSRSEALQVYRMANGGSLRGILPSYLWAYESLLYFYDLLQAAGPDLTPAALHRAEADVAELPPSAPGGSLGTWRFGAGTVAPSASFQLLHWVPGATSAQDGQPGTFEPCYGGRVFSYTAPHGGVPQHTAPACPT